MSVKLSKIKFVVLQFFYIFVFSNICYSFEEETDFFYLNQIKNLTSDQEQETFFERKHLRTILINISDVYSDEYFCWQKKAFIHKLLWETLPSIFCKNDLISCVKNNLFLDGYLESSVDFDLKENCLKIFFGKKSFIYGMSLKTTEEIPDNVRNLFQLTNKKITVSSLLERQKQAIVLLKKKGFLDCKVNVKIIKTVKLENKKSAFTAEVIINLGHLARFGKINFTGNYNLQKTFLKKHLPFSQGDLWNSKNIYIAKKNLEYTGIFSNVEISCGGPLKNQSDKKSDFSIPINILLTEDLSNEVKFSFGISPKGAKNSFFINPEAKNNYLFSGLNIYNKFEVSKYNLFSSYDKINCLAGFDIEKKFIQFKYNIGFLKNLPLENELSLLFENDNSILQNHKFGYSIFGLQNSLNKPLNNYFVFKATASLLFGNIVNKEERDKALFLKYLQVSPSLTINKIVGNWFEEEGFSLFNSIGLNFSLKNNQHIFNTELFLTTIIPLFSSLSIACRIGTILQWPMKNKISTKEPFSLKEIEPFFNYKHREQCFDDLIFTCDYNKRNLTIPQLFNNCLHPSKKDFFYSFEIRKLLLQNFGVAMFTNIKVKDFLSANISIGSSFRYNFPVGTLFFNLGWNNLDKSLFWQMRLGDVSF